MTYSIRIGLLALLGAVIGAGIFQVLYRQPIYQLKETLLSAQSQAHQKEAQEASTLNSQSKRAAIFLSGLSQSIDFFGQRVAQNERRLLQAQSKEIITAEKAIVPPVIVLRKSVAILLPESTIIIAGLTQYFNPFSQPQIVQNKVVPVVTVLKKPPTEIFSGFSQSFDLLSQRIVQNEQNLWQGRSKKILSIENEAVPPVIILKKPLPVQLPESTSVISDLTQYFSPSRQPQIVQNKVVPPVTILGNASVEIFAKFAQPFDFISQQIVQEETIFLQPKSSVISQRLSPASKFAPLPKQIIIAEKKVVEKQMHPISHVVVLVSGPSSSFDLISQRIVQNEEKLWQGRFTESPAIILEKPLSMRLPKSTSVIPDFAQSVNSSIQPHIIQNNAGASATVLKLPDHINLLNQSEALLKKTIAVEQRAIPPVIILKKPLPLPLSNTVVLVSGLSQYLNIFTPVAPHPKKGNVVTLRKTLPLVTSLQAPLPALPISIQSAALLGDEGHTQFVIRLSQKPFYIVRTDGAHQTITLMIDNVNPDISAIPPLDISGTAIQNIAFNVSKENQLLVTLTLLPQVDVQGLRFKDDNLILDVGIGPQIPYVQSQNGAAAPAETVEPIVKTLVPLTSDELATQNYDEAVDLLSQGNIAGATGLLEVVVTEHPSDLDARVLLARLWLQQNEPTQALNLLEGAMPQPTIQENVTFYDLLAEAYRQTGDPKSAIVMYQQLLRQDASNGVWWVGLGMCFKALNQDAASTEAYQKALATGKLPPVLQTFISKKLDLIK
ncbi:MAG TPA: tetratricopeptide repeat protein [Gammaproteobacteria bacterium]|nr:tetratricopeptide repeat protein [Gammaproteobacteria bacterium]